MLIQNAIYIFGVFQGGNESEAQVRQNQQMILMQTKYQKKVSMNKCVCLFLELKRKLFL